MKMTSQEQILNWFVEKYSQEPNKFYSVPELAKELNIVLSNGIVYRKVNQLYAFGYLDIYVEYFPLKRYFKYKKQK